jgi:hypothetical protein
MSSFERLGAATEPLPPPAASWRGRRFEEDRLHLLVRDPRRVFAAWEVSASLARRAAAMAASAGAPLRFVLAIERSESAPSQGAAPAETIRVPLPDAILGDGWYVDLPRGGGFARAVLGIEIGAGDAGQAPLLASRWMPVPPQGQCREEGEWPVDEARRAWLAREAERLRGRAVPSLPSSAARYLTSPPVRRA